jgi:hypothetical protein
MEKRMPEVWLKYGKVEVALEIQRERLGQIIEDPLPDIEIEQIEKELQPLKENKEINLLVGDFETTTIKFLQYLANYLVAAKVNIYSSDQILKQLKKSLRDLFYSFLKIEEERFPVGIVDGVPLKLPAILSKTDLYLISSVGYNPLFGFSGGPTCLLAFCGDDLKYEAIKRETELQPNSGKETSAGWFANRVSEEVSGLKGVEILPGSSGFSKIFLGNVQEVHKIASQELLKYSMKKVSSKVSLAIVAPGEEEKYRTLDLSLNSLWNVLQAMEEGSTVILLSEAIESLGSEALSRYVYTGLDIKDLLKRGPYLEGLENLYYLSDIKTKYDLGFLTTLPKALIEKRLGFKSFLTGNSTVDYLIEKSGDKKKKITIVTRGDKSLLTAV